MRMGPNEGVVLQIRPGKAKDWKIVAFVPVLYYSRYFVVRRSSISNFRNK